MSHFIHLLSTLVEMLRKQEQEVALKLIDKWDQNVYIKLYMDGLSGQKSQLWWFISFH
jgi:hypothetical protein